MRRLAKVDGVVAVQVLDVRTGEVVPLPDPPAAESGADARARAASVLRSLAALDHDDGAAMDDADPFGTVPPGWRASLETGEHAIYQARVGEGRILEALVSKETQEIEDLLDTTVEQLEAHFAGGEGEG